MLFDYANQITQQQLKPDEKYSRNSVEDFHTAIDLWLAMGKELKKLHPEAVRSILRFIKTEITDGHF